jgi:hypothetical protein
MECWRGGEKEIKALHDAQAPSQASIRELKKRLFLMV